jgi:hypothetical protein
VLAIAQRSDRPLTEKQTQLLNYLHFQYQIILRAQVIILQRFKDLTLIASRHKL